MILHSGRQVVRRTIGDQEVDAVYQGDKLVWRKARGVINSDFFDTYPNGPLTNVAQRPWLIREWPGTAFRINVNNGLVTMGGGGTTDTVREGIAIHTTPTNTDNQLVQVKVGNQGSAIRGTSIILRSDALGDTFIGMQIVANVIAVYRSINRATTVLGPGVQNIPYRVGGTYSFAAIENNYFCFLDDQLLYTYTEASPTVPRGQRHVGFSVQWGRTFFQNTISPAVDQFVGGDA